MSHELVKTTICRYFHEEKGENEFKIYMRIFSNEIDRMKERKEEKTQANAKYVTTNMF